LIFFSGGNDAGMRGVGVYYTTQNLGLSKNEGNSSSLSVIISSDNNKMRENRTGLDTYCILFIIIIIIIYIIYIFQSIRLTPIDSIRQSPPLIIMIMIIIMGSHTICRRKVKGSGTFCYYHDW